MFEKNYRPTSPDFWSGRVDDTEDYDAFRWHQIVELIDLLEPDMPSYTSGFCLLGFCCDKGVAQNLGRTGTSKGPISIRREMTNLPCSFPQGTRIYDAGDIFPFDGVLEDVQKALSEAVCMIFKLGLFPIVLGGGHEIAYGHYLGIEKFLQQRTARLGIVNLDAHFDMRPFSQGPSSGSMFLQIAQRCNQRGYPFSYMVLGIQQYGNTVSLFKSAKKFRTNYIMARDISNGTLSRVHKKIDDFIDQHDHIYLTLCADVISSAYAPGVSAPQPFGLHPEIILQLIKIVVRSGKALSFDIAEVSPRFDEDNRTSKLAAIIAFAVINTVIETAAQE